MSDPPFSHFGVEYCNSEDEKCDTCENHFRMQEICIKKIVHKPSGNNETLWVHFMCFVLNRIYYGFQLSGAVLPGFCDMSTFHQKAIATELPPLNLELEPSRELKEDLVSSIVKPVPSETSDDDDDDDGDKNDTQSESKSSSEDESNVASRENFSEYPKIPVDTRSCLEKVAHVYKYEKTTYSKGLTIKDDQNKKLSYFKIQVLESNNNVHERSFWLFSISGKNENDFDQFEIFKHKSAAEACAKFDDLYAKKAKQMGLIDENVMTAVRSDQSRDERQRPSYDRNRGNQGSGRLSESAKEKNRELASNDAKRRSYSDCLQNGKRHENRDNNGENSSNSSIQRYDRKGRDDQTYGRSDSVNKLVILLFNVENMEKAMASIKVDTGKLPLKKLNAKLLTDAFKVLEDLKTTLRKEHSKDKVHDLSKEFYKLIPMEKDKHFDISDFAKYSDKHNVVKALFNLQTAFSKYDKNERDTENRYAVLDTDITSVKPDSPGFKLIEKYVQNTQVHQTKLTIIEVFMVKRYVEKERYESLKRFDNRMLLWHGSDITNFAGILINGFKRASTVQGKFGSGIYFTDTVSKAANSCRNSGKVILLALCEVALGNALRMKDVEVVNRIPKGKDSVLGLGKNLPDLHKAYKRKDGVAIPLERLLKPETSTGYGKPETGSLRYNEYMIQNENQINIQYLVRLKVD